LDKLRRHKNEKKKSLSTLLSTSSGSVDLAEDPLCLGVALMRPVAAKPARSCSPKRRASDVHLMIDKKAKLERKLSVSTSSLCSACSDTVGNVEAPGTAPSQTATVGAAEKKENKGHHQQSPHFASFVAAVAKTKSFLGHRRSGSSGGVVGGTSSRSPFGNNELGSVRRISHGQGFPASPAAGASGLSTQPASRQRAGSDDRIENHGVLGGILRQVNVNPILQTIKFLLMDKNVLNFRPIKA
jgi:hypothetical protein